MTVAGLVVAGVLMTIVSARGAAAMADRRRRVGEWWKGFRILLGVQVALLVLIAGTCSRAF